MEMRVPCMTRLCGEGTRVEEVRLSEQRPSGAERMCLRTPVGSTLGEETARAKALRPAAAR